MLYCRRGREGGEVDARKPLAEGTVIVLGSKPYTIQSLVGYGGTSFVYSASYPDGIQPNKTHCVLLKELFPFHPADLIFRGEHGEIVVSKEAAAYFELCKKSFYQGNIVHIDIQNIRADMANVNIDSFEENDSLYTVIGNLNGETLQRVVGHDHSAPSISSAVSWTLSILDALEIFHKNGLLHLDISPDNILLLPLDKGKSEKMRKILLIDFNSVWNMKELMESPELYFSVKEHYSAPEIRMNQRSEIAASTDLFSVCAVFSELLSGKPLDFSLLYTGGHIFSTEAKLLIGVPAAVSAKAASIVRRGLKLPPGRRYQNITELRADLLELSDLIYGEDVFDKLTKLHNRRTVPIIAISVALAVSLSFAAFHISNTMNSYPASVQEVNAVKNTMDALYSSLMKLGVQIQNDLNALHAYEEGYSEYQYIAARNQIQNESLILEEIHTEDSLEIYKTRGSPLRFDLLLELLNAPFEYKIWSDNMHRQLNNILVDDSPYLPEDQDAIKLLYEDYVKCKAQIYYSYIQLIALPINGSGKRDFLEGLPYVTVFGEIFSERAFINEEAEIESIIKAENIKLQDIIVKLKAYGMEG
jgi:serine/threonine protein kinase